MKKENIFWDPATFKTNSTYNSVRVCSQEESSQVQNVCSRFGQLTFCKCVQDSNGINVTLTINWTETSWSLFSLHFKSFFAKAQNKIHSLLSFSYFSSNEILHVFVLTPCWSVLDFWEINLEKSNLRNWIFSIFRTGFLLPV